MLISFFCFHLLGLKDDKIPRKNKFLFDEYEIVIEEEPKKENMKNDDKHNLSMTRIC